MPWEFSSSVAFAAQAQIFLRFPDPFASEPARNLLLFPDPFAFGPVQIAIGLRRECHPFSYPEPSLMLALTKVSDALALLAA